VQGCGGGGGGGYAYSIKRIGVGGGGGGYFEKTITVLAGDTKDITIGSGGDGGIAASGASSTAGGTTSFDTDCSATGGSAGDSNVSSSSESVALGETGSSGNINLTGMPGYASEIQGQVHHYISVGGASYFGTGPRSAGVTIDANGTSATNYGAGGSGALSNTDSNKNGGAGKQGIVIIWY
jgi:hypothetical protein